MATLFKTNGETILVVPENQKKFTLEELQKYVGGYIEILTISDNNFMVINEEGKLEQLPLNDKATEIYIKHFGFNDIIVGDVLIVSNDDID